MSYKTRYGQTIFDVMIQNKGSLKGLDEFIGDLTSLTEPFFQGEELNIEFEENSVTDFLDSKDLVSATVEIEILDAPTLFAFNTPTTSTIDYSYTSNSGGTESGFEVQLSLLSDFSVIEQTDNLASGVTTGQFTGLTDGTLYYGRVRATGAVNSDWSNTDSEITNSLFADVSEMFSMLQMVTITDNLNGNLAFKIRRSSDNATTDVLWQDNIYSSISLSSPVSAGGDLGTWVGANDAFIQVWYKQSKTFSNNISNNVAAQQPRIINSGSLTMKDGFPEIEFGWNSVITVLQNVVDGAETNNAHPTEDLMHMTVGHNDITLSNGNASTWMGNQINISRLNDAIFFDLTTVFFDSVTRNNTDTRVLTETWDNGAATMSVFGNGTNGDQNVASNLQTGNDWSIGDNVTSPSTNFLTGSVRFSATYRESDIVNRVALETKLASLFSITYPS